MVLHACPVRTELTHEQSRKSFNIEAQHVTQFKCCQYVRITRFHCCLSAMYKYYIRGWFSWALQEKRPRVILRLRIQVNLRRRVQGHALAETIRAPPCSRLETTWMMYLYLVFWAFIDVNSTVFNSTISYDHTSIMIRCVSCMYTCTSSAVYGKNFKYD